MISWSAPRFDCSPCDVRPEGVRRRNFVQRASENRVEPRGSAGAGVVRRPDELAPVVLRELDPGLKPLFGLQEVPHAHQQPALDGLTVPASLAVARGTAEMNSGEIGSVHIEQRQRRVAVGPAGSVSGMVPAHAGTDVITEMAELAPPVDERA